MYDINREMYEKVGFNYSTDRPDIRELLEQARDITKKEAMVLYRMARRAEAHGCSTDLVEAIREEARFLDNSHYPQFLFNPFEVWHFAFHYPNNRNRYKPEPEWW